MTIMGDFTKLVQLVFPLLPMASNFTYDTNGGIQ
jgi:hypothetical protein